MKTTLLEYIMQSVQTKETAPALAALLKAKGQRVTALSATVEQPAAVLVENSITEIPATPQEAPEVIVEEQVTKATPIETPVSNERYSEENYLNLKAHHDKTVYELRQEVKQLKDTLTQATTPKLELPKSKEELAEFKKTNPDAYDVMRAIALDAAQELGSDVHKQLEEVNKAQAMLREKEAFGKLLEAHPDAKEIRASVEFAKWFNEQPEAIRNTLANSADVESVIKLLTLYKIEALGYNPKEKKKAAAKERIDASLSVDIKGKTEVIPQKKMWTGSEIRAICANYATWNKYREEIDAARREGRVDETK